MRRFIFSFIAVVFSIIYFGFLLPNGSYVYGQKDLYGIGGSNPDNPYGDEGNTLPGNNTTNSNVDGNSHTTSNDGNNNNPSKPTPTNQNNPTSTNQNNPSTTTSSSDGCNGIKLNTNFPIIGNCIRIKGEGAINPTNAFPTMLRALTKIIMSLILVVCFILIIYAGILWSADKPKDAKKWIERVAITILLLGFSGVILKLVNPNFFS